MNAIQRFSNRVGDYVKYRPHYPKEIIPYLQENCRLIVTSSIADIGSGTGILSELFVENGNLVYGIEPNLEMREAGERFLQKHPSFRSIVGTAENTTLLERSMDFIVVGQAFHWFDREKAKLEFERILKPNSWVVLIWNDRKIDSTPFLQSYEQLLQNYGTDYRQVDHKQIDENVLGSFFGDYEFEKALFNNSQTFDFVGLKGRLLSSSYTPEVGHPNYDPMLSELKNIFDKYQKQGKVSFEYDTVLYRSHWQGS